MASGNPTVFSGVNSQQGLDVSNLFKLVNNAMLSAQAKLKIIQSKNSAVSIADMFEMQMLMNHLSQLSEMATNVISAANAAIQSMARNVK